MQVNRKLMEHFEHLTNAEITSAIRYLDPDASKRTGNDGGAILWAILIVLIGAFIYIGVNLRTF